MKFGQKIKACHGRGLVNWDTDLAASQTSLYSEWRGKYLDYDALKRVLKERTENGPWTDEDEQHFTDLLEGELEKIHAFQREKVFQSTPTQASMPVFDSLIVQGI